MSGKRRTEQERAIIYAGVMGGLSKERIDERLPEGRELDAGSYAMVKRRYVPYFLGDLNRLGAAIAHPPTLGQIKASLALDQEDGSREGDDDVCGEPIIDFA